MDGLKALSERSQNRRRGSRLPPGTRATSRCPRFRQAFEPRRDLTPSPKKSPSSTAMSPKLMPIRLFAATFTFYSITSRCNAPVRRPSRY
jgi:hypothetical protein